MDFSEEMTDEIFKIFQVESEEIISKLNNSLLDLEKKPNNKDVILMLFRDAHTLKGASRMVGLNNVQTVAHKMEDVLGLAKENKIQLNSKVVDILYKTVDFLSEMIQKSIEKRQDVYSEDIHKHISVLDNIGDYADDAKPQEEQVDFDTDFLKKNSDKINNALSESLFTLMLMEIAKAPELIKNLLSSVTELYGIFEKIGDFEIKKEFEDIKVKLEFTIKGSNSLTGSEIAQLHQSFDSIINKLIPIWEIYNLEIVDHYSAAFEKMSKQEKPEKKVPPTSPDKIPDKVVEKIEKKEEKPQDFGDFEVVQKRVTDLAKNSDSANEIKEVLMNFSKTCTNNDVKKVFEKIVKILDFSAQNEIKIDEETGLVLEQSIEHCDNILKNKSKDADNELVLQRLEIILQVLEFSRGKDYGFVSKNEPKMKPQKVADFSEIFNTGEIKTLRVDSTKLDTLVNQINELTITNIKAKKHLHSLNIINQELEEWQKDSVKALNYLKYYEKKYFQHTSPDSPFAFFIKQLLNLYTDNNKKVQDAVGDIATLHRTIQEDDAKMGLIVENLDSMIKNVRVLPLATVFHLFGRMVRDIAREKQKEIELEIVGSETSTDKKIIEEIKTPLIHIIRNAIDHGIETPQERAALGKSAVGKIVLSARQAGNRVIIEIIDDGRGLNLEKIKSKAIQKGYLTQDEINSMTDEQITNIIFAPGFSTGDEITNISGRGIGLDVVQSKISQLNGKVRVISELNKGCCVQIELPTTMSTLKAFLVKSAEQTFAIPMEAINTVLRKSEDEIISNKEKRSIIFNEKTIPLYDLADILKLESTPQEKAKETILIIEGDGKIMALCVDKLIGDQEILHKKLSPPFYRLKNISGITTLASGEICLILRIADILKTTGDSKIKSISKKNKGKQNSDYKILLVDDSITTRTLEKNILATAGYNIETAQNPFEAFEKLKNTHFDLIISDIEMPGMDGFEFLEKLKTDEKYAEIPVIMVSSVMDEETKKCAMELGAVKYIIKGEFSQSDFHETINKILKRENGLF